MWLVEVYDSNYHNISLVTCETDTDLGSFISNLDYEMYTLGEIKGLDGDLKEQKEFIKKPKDLETGGGKENAIEK